MALENVKGTHVLGGLAAVALLLAVISDGAPDNDAWGGGADEDAASVADADRSELRGDDGDAWSVPEPGEEGSLPTCTGTAPFASGGGTVRLPTDGPVVPVASADCGMGVGRGGGEAVRLLQEALVACNEQSITVDGRYGDATRAAVRAVQQRHGIGTDGAYGPQTRDVMSWPTLTSGGDGVETACATHPGTG
ncbi:MAG TPA: peptidoglycan-binding domain-containing protein [Acidimicrobiales bacterium]